MELWKIAVSSLFGSGLMFIIMAKYLSGYPLLAIFVFLVCTWFFMGAFLLADWIKKKMRGE